MMKIALVDSFFSGSHKKWGLDLQKFCKYPIHIFSMYGIHWKWRMHGGAITLAKQINDTKIKFDIFLVTDMVDIYVFKALISKKNKSTPIIMYFHENQIMYPKSKLDTDIKDKRDNHYGFINFTSALAADKVIFNSKFHFVEFLNNLKTFLNQFPDYSIQNEAKKIKDKSMVIPLGVDFTNIKYQNKSNKIKNLLWNHRWEYDKNPNQFFKILFKLDNEGINFKINIIGQKYRGYPKIFDEAKNRLKNKINKWGFANSLYEYNRILSLSDILPVTSYHDFFGLSTVEAISNGVIPLLPNRLAYPEHVPKSVQNKFLYNSNDDFYTKLKNLIINYEEFKTNDIKNYISKYDMKIVIKKYEECFERIS